MPAPESSQLQTYALPCETVFDLARAPILFFWSRSLLENPVVERQRLLEVEVPNSRGGTLMWAS